MSKPAWQRYAPALFALVLVAGVIAVPRCKERIAPHREPQTPHGREKQLSDQRKEAEKRWWAADERKDHPDHLGAAAGPERTELLRQLVEDSGTDRPDRALTLPAV
jgi:hypothetical protein